MRTSPFAPTPNRRTPRPVENTGYVTFEYFHPYPHYPEALVYQSSDSLDRMLGRLG